MKKVGLSILVLWIFSSPAHAQLGISGGLMGGLNSASVSGADVSGDAKNLTGYAWGVFLGVNLPGPWAIEGQALYSMKGSKVPTASYTTTFDYRYLDIPVLLKYYLPIPVVRPYLFIGPSYSILLEREAKIGGRVHPDHGSRCQGFHVRKRCRSCGGGWGTLLRSEGGSPIQFGTYNP